MKNNQLTQLDLDQALKRTIDPTSDAQRVTVVSGDIKVDVDTKAIQKSLEQSFKSVELNMQPVVIKEPQIVEVPVIVKETEIQVVEKFIETVRYEKIEVPVYTTTTEVVKIEVPVIVKETQVIEVAKEDKITKFAIIGLLILNILLLLKGR